MKSLIIGIDASRAFVQDPAGPEYYSLNLIKSLAKIDQKNRYILYLRSGQRLNLRLPHNFIARRIGMRYLWTQVFLAKEVIINPPDVLFIPAHTLPLLASFLLPQLPIVVTVHGLEGKYLPQTGMLLSHIYRNWSITWAIKRAKGLVAVSKDTYREVIKTYKIPPKKIKVIYEGVDLRRFSAKPTDLKLISLKINQKNINYETRNILFVGTVQPRKNLVRLIEAFAGLPQNTRLLLAGKLGWLYEDILEAPERFGVRDRVVFLGRILDKDLPKLYKLAQVFVLPSLTEGFGLPVLEAQASGVPVVVSRAGALPEVAGNGAIFINPLSVESIKRGLEKVLAKPALQRRLVEKGYKNAASFSWEKAASNTLDFLSKVYYRK